MEVKFSLAKWANLTSLVRSANFTYESIILSKARGIAP